jgi:LPS-assembly lipoprotein
VKIELRNLRFLTLCLLFLLAGCGFHLKGFQQTSSTLEGVFIKDADNRKSLAGTIRRNLLQSGVKLVESADSARYQLQIHSERFRQRVASVDANGKALEYELSLNAQYSLLDGQGRALVSRQPMDLLRLLSFSGDDELGKRAEIQLTKEDMHREMGWQIIRQAEAQVDNAPAQ